MNKKIQLFEGCVKIKLWLMVIPCFPGLHTCHLCGGRQERIGEDPGDDPADHRSVEQAQATISSSVQAEGS